MQALDSQATTDAGRRWLQASAAGRGARRGGRESIVPTPGPGMGWVDTYTRIAVGLYCPPSFPAHDFSPSHLCFVFYILVLVISICLSYMEIVHTAVNLCQAECFAIEMYYFVCTYPHWYFLGFVLVYINK